MQSSNQQGASDRRYDDCLEELHWENGQLLAITPLREGESNKPTKGSTIASQFSRNMARQSSAAEDHTLEGVSNDERRVTKFPVNIPAIESLDWLDGSLNHEGSVAMQQNSMLASSYSYEASERINSRNFLQQESSIRGNPEGVTRTLCSPSIRNGLQNVDPGVNMAFISSMQPSMIQEHFDKSSGAIVNSISSHCMTSLPVQSSQNTLFSRSSGDAAVFSASHTDLIPNLQGASNCTNSHASVGISRPLDLESVLLDSSELTHMSFSCGSGHIPNKGNKVGEISGNKKSRASDDFDSESEGSYDDAVALKKPRLGQPVSTKRTRAADIHNQSERIRRGRINEKLKALQELIPNSNKTDKASVLSEAIDYLKKLRLQLQVMCCRNGMNISPLLISQGPHQLQVPLTGTGTSHGGQPGIGFAVNATSASFPSFSLPPNLGSSAQVHLGTIGLPEVRASAEAPFMSTNSLHSSGIPATYGPTSLTSPDSFHHPFQLCGNVFCTMTPVIAATSTSHHLIHSTVGAS